jgi:excisionase family DNA binding protein
MADTTAMTPRCTGTSIPRSPSSCGMASRWEHMDTTHDHEHNHTAVSHAPQPTRTPTRSTERGPHPRPRATSPVAGLRRSPGRAPGNGRCPRSPRSRAALTVWIRGSPQADIGSCEIEPPTSAVNYPQPGSAARCCASAPSSAGAWRSCRRPSFAVFGGAGLLAAAPWTRYQARRNDPLGLWPALGVGPHDRPVRTARSRVTAASSLAPLPPSWPDDHSVQCGPGTASGSAARKGMPGGSPTQRQGRPRPAPLSPYRRGGRHLDVSPKTVSRWAKEGKLPFLKTLGGHRRYPAAEIRQLADQLQVRPTA